MKGSQPRRKMDSIIGLLNMHKTGKLFCRLAIDRRVPWLLKLYAVSGLIYFFSPLDVVPHDFTGFGLVDDIIVALVIMQAMIEMSPPAVVDEHCERLGIDPDKVFMPVPLIVADAMEMFYSAKGRRTGVRPDHAWDDGSGRRAAPEPAEPVSQEPPPYTRYSAFREDD